jgi:type IV pilus assembly protein PilP
MKLRLAPILMLFLLAACSSGNTGDLQHFVKDAYKDRKPRIESMPEVKVQEKFAYSASGLPDPFSVANLSGASNVAVDNSNDSGPRPDPTRVKEPLEDYSLASLAMVGTLKREHTMYGIIKVTVGDGDVYKVKVGDHMGRNFGMITKITDNQITLVELVKSALGGWVEKETSLQLKE